MILEMVKEKCYQVDNNFAYKYEKYKSNASEKNLQDLTYFLKYMNFVPIYDKWCLNCGNKTATKKCGKCKSVYFCNVECQRAAWKIHSKHCGRDLFVLCINCGEKVTTLKCDDCPVRFCSENCKSKIIQPHQEIDCKYFANTFNKK